MINELYHHGIKGMRWGVRRYRNKDGTLTEAGKRRLSMENKGKRVQFDEKTGKINDKDINNVRRANSNTYRYASEDYNSLSNIGNSASNVARSASNLAKRSADRKRSRMADRIDLSNMSDRDLQQAINRMNMERSYKRLKSEEIRLGRDAVSDILSTAGEVVAIGAGISIVASNIYKMKAGA